MVLNFICFILSIILRCWRSDGSVLNQNFSAFNSAAIFNLVLVIINILASITEDVLFSFVISFLALYLDDEYFNYAFGFDAKDVEDTINIINSIISYNADSPEDLNDLKDMLNKFKIILKKGKKFEKIMNKNYKKKLYSFLENINDYDKKKELMRKKIKPLKILPWITINFNIFMQLLIFIFLIIIINRIKLRSDFGFPQSKNDESFKNKMLGIR